MRSNYQLGKLVFSISGNDKVLPYLSQELACIKVDEIDSSHLDFTFTDDLPVMKNDYSLTKPLTVENSSYYVSHQYLNYVASFSPLESSLKISISTDPLKLKHTLVPNWIEKSYDWSFLTKEERSAHSFIYNVFDYLSQSVNLSLGQTYIHASGFSREDYGVLVAARGGTGKTTSMLKFVIEDGWKYISDDLVIVDIDGNLWRTPKKLQVYAYNLQGEPQISHQLLNGRNLIDKTAWILHKLIKGKHKVRWRIIAEDLFGKDLVANSARLRKAFFLERVNIESFQRVSISKNDFSQRLAMMLLEEIDPFCEFSIALHSNGHKKMLPSVTDFIEKTKTILEKAFMDSETILIRVPLNANPTQLHSYLAGCLSSF